jgi:3-phenylpropionate/trans-cinnamate dioxygenase ferredoxin reductase component
MADYEYIILGGGVVAGYAVQTFVENGIQPDTLALISADDMLPYERPALSKDYLDGDANTDDILINDENFYRDNGIEVFLKTRVERINTIDRTLHTTAGDTFSFDKLLIATGSKVKMLDIPGADSNGVEYLRWLDDSSDIRGRINADTRAVVLGGGYIGMETAAVLAENDIPVTMVFPNDRLMESRFMTPEISAFFEQYYRDRGVEIITDDLPERIVADENDHVKAVMLQSGKRLDANLVIAGIGVEPADDLFEGTQLEIDDGLLVDEYLQTNLDGIYAAGDIANYYDMIFDKRRRIGHWDIARKHGQYAARRMMGAEEKPFTTVPYFFSDVFDLSYEFWGEATDADEVVYRGDISADGFSAWWIRNERLIGAFVMDRPDDEREAAQQYIAARTRTSANILKNADPMIQTITS